MNKKILLASLLALSASSASFADRDYSQPRRAGVFFGSALAGAVVAGPIGMVAAAMGGVWLDQQVIKAATLDESLAEQQAQLADTEEQFKALQYRLALAEHRSAQYADIALEQLQLQMLFKTGQAELTATSKARLKLLADFMESNSQFTLRLDGYADPRGDSQYNLQLSSDRVAAVAEQLAAAGIDPQRIEQFSHGASQSTGLSGDYDGYALERMVSIALQANPHQSQSPDAVAQNLLP